MPINLACCIKASDNLDRDGVVRCITTEYNPIERRTMEDKETQLSPIPSISSEFQIVEYLDVNFTESGTGSRIAGNPVYFAIETTVGIPWHTIGCSVSGNGQSLWLFHTEEDNVVRTRSSHVNIAG